MLTLLRIIELVLLMLAVMATGSPYADDFPYHAYRPPQDTFPTGGKAHGTSMSGASSKGGGTEGTADGRDFRKDQAFDETGSINSANDAVRYHKLDNQLNGQRVLDTSKGTTVDKVKHLAGENFEADKTHNRKHIKSGFSNSYHKDESGSKSSYYEDSDDRGGKQVFDNRQNLRNDYADKLYSQDRRNDFLRDHYDDRQGGTDLHDGHNHHRVAAQDRGNRHGYRDGYAHGDRNDQRYGATAYGGYDYYQPSNYQQRSVVAHHQPFDGSYHQQRSYYEPRPPFTTSPLQSGPITIYEDPRHYQAHWPVPPYAPYHTMPREQLLDADTALSRDANRLVDGDFSGRRRLVYKFNSLPPPAGDYRRRY
ncbi:uncharacterized protein LOC131213478 [Anopheles bellator]|uniref:uncharacterized protein LOC131213478 n=1 Tax=Anopheles bellator TaxID=139047 RepID=UPI0026497939|nr:uncharacterized protein LOC131213478 [Anopheles bellator]